MKTGHIFAGAGGGLLADLILGHTPILAIDIDEDCCENLRQRKEGWFPELEIIRADATSFDASRYEGRLDILHAGIPCPKWSSAKRGQGETFDGLPSVINITNQCKPKQVFIKCVANFRKNHDAVYSAFRSINYELSDPLITDTASMGAPHSRKRYWAIAYPDHEGKPVRHINAKTPLLPKIDCGLWWEAKPRISRMDDGVANRVHRFKVTGNGQVPLQAAAAYLMLTR